MREDQILRHAYPHMEEGERVTHWARARSADGKGSGFLYLTDRRIIAHFGADEKEQAAIPWTAVDSWGIDDGAALGPLLVVEDEDQDGTLIVANLPVSSKDRTTAVNRFLQEFSDMAPWPRRALRSAASEAAKPSTGVRVDFQKRSLTAKTMRIIKTVAALVLGTIGILIIPVPGPWSFLLNLAALAILASEYDWAEDLLDWTRDRYQAAKNKLKRRKRSKRST